MSKVREKWNELKVLVESMELDVHKNSNGNASAGIRARKGLRALKTAAAELVKLTIEEEKSRKGQGPNGFDQVRKTIRARQWEAMVTVKTLKNTNANDDVELQDFALAA